MSVSSYFMLRARHGEPGIFALVMATGIVSIAVAGQGLRMLGLALFYLNLAAYVFLHVLGILRALFYPQHMLAMFAASGRGVSYLTLTAGTFVLANQCLWVVHWPHVAFYLALWGTLTWFVLIYAVLFTAITQRHKHPFGELMQGSWLLFVVATQAMAISLTAMPAYMALPWSTELRFVAVLLFLLGCAWYLILITLIVYRMVFKPFSGQAFTPPYWINMGALAITTLAGALLVPRLQEIRMLADLAPFVKGSTLLAWGLATWWIPLLSWLEIWRHTRERIPFAYSVGYWSMVFPLGMYAAATAQLGRVMGFALFGPMARSMAYVGLLAWLLVSTGFVRQYALSYPVRKR